MMRVFFHGAVSYTHLTKKLHLRSIIYELLWFLKGETNIKFLKDNGVSIWDEWADENGELGPVDVYKRQLQRNS